MSIVFARWRVNLAEPLAPAQLSYSHPRHTQTQLFWGLGFSTPQTLQDPFSGPIFCAGGPLTRERPTQDPFSGPIFCAGGPLTRERPTPLRRRPGRLQGGFLRPLTGRVFTGNPLQARPSLTKPLGGGTLRGPCREGPYENWAEISARERLGF